MSTVAATRPDVATRRDGRQMDEVSAPVLFQFQAPKESIAGVLVSIDEVNVKGKPVTQYVLRLDDGKRVQLLATWDLSRKIQREHLGRYIEIVYLGENREVKKGDNYLREFRVSVEKRNAQNNHDITDADVPF